MPKRIRSAGFVDRARIAAMTEDEIEALARADNRSLGMPDELPTEGWYRGDRYPNARVVREALGLSQSEFALRFGLSVRTIQHWEQHRTVPDRAALVLLKTIEVAPEAVARAVATMRVRAPKK